MNITAGGSAAWEAGHAMTRTTANQLLSCVLAVVGEESLQSGLLPPGLAVLCIAAGGLIAATGWVARVRGLVAISRQPRPCRCTRRLDL